MGYKWGYCSNMMVLIDLISYLGVSEHGGWTRQIAITQYEKHWKKMGKAGSRKINPRIPLVTCDVETWTHCDVGLIKYLDLPSG